jgi:DNA modification methylase
LPTLPAESVQCVVTSPPYLGLRDYGTALWDGGDADCDHKQGAMRRDADRVFPTAGPDRRGSFDGGDQQFRDTCGKCGAVRVDRQIGLEPTPDEYLATMVGVFREVRRVLRRDGTCWVNMGDSYNANQGSGFNGNAGKPTASPKAYTGLAPKQLLLMPARLALALQADGWWVRSDIIWCLSGGTRVYARTQKGEMPMSIKDMVRLDPATVQLWTGQRWTQVLGWNETARPDRTYEIELRNGQRIGCTAGHLWPTQHGNMRADALNVGDIIRTCRLPEPAPPKRPSALDDEMVGWLVGLYIAEGSQSEGTIQIASHLNEDVRFDSLRRVAEAFHATVAIHKTSEHGCTVNLNGPVLNGIINAYVSGKIASDKHLHPRCWQRSDAFLSAILAGYLSGDGHWDAGNERWRLGFCNNDELVADLRTIGARIGASVRLKRVVHKIADAEFAGYKGEIRFSRSLHHNSRDDGEIVAIRESRARKFWDIGVEDADHLFALASGVLTHNSKPNPMPESVTDRPTSAHEHVFLLTRSARYFYDADAVREEAEYGRSLETASWHAKADANSAGVRFKSTTTPGNGGSRNLRNVWTLSTESFSGAHFATFPSALAERCIKAGTSERGCCAACGKPWARVTERQTVRQLADECGTWAERPAAAGYGEAAMTTQRRDATSGLSASNSHNASTPQSPSVTTTGWSPGCQCDAGVVPCTILDPFAGAGTSLLCADRLQRDAIGIELNTAYTELAMERCRADAPLFTAFPPAEPPEDERMADLFANMAAD